MEAFFWNTAKQLSTSKPIYKIIILLPSNDITCTIIFNLFYSYVRKYFISSSFYKCMEIALATRGISHPQGEIYWVARTWENFPCYTHTHTPPISVYAPFERIWKQFASLSRWVKIQNKYGSLGFLKLKAQAHFVL